MAEKRKDNKGRNLRDGETQRPDGRYRYRYNDSRGNRHDVYSWKLVSTDKLPEGKADCVSLREMEKEIQRDLDDGIRLDKRKNLTVNDMFQEYMKNKPELKDTSTITYDILFKKHVQPEFGKRKIASVKFSDVKRFYNSLFEKGLKISSIELIHAILRPVFTLAVRDDIIRKNPTDGAMKELKKAHDYQKAKRHALTIEEQSEFINFVSSSPRFKRWLPLFTVLLGTGGRIGEITGLRWEDCDFKNNVISINHTLVYDNFDGNGCTFRITTPKTAAGTRTIPMLQEVKKALLEERKKQMEHGFCTVEIDGYSGFVFTTRNNNLIVKENVNQTIKRICKAYNQSEAEKAKKEKREPFVIRSFSAHNLRHTFCTRFCENESNIKLIQSIMGHANINTTMDVYAEATESKKQEGFQNLQGKIKIS